MNGSQLQSRTETDLQANTLPAAEEAEAVSLIRGKGTRRARCAGCHALVLAEALDLAGQCDSCGSQAALFPMKPHRRRPVGARSRRGRRPAS